MTTNKQAKQREYNQRYYAKHGEALKLRQRDYERARAPQRAAQRRANPAKALLKSSKNRARRDGIEFSISLTDIVVPARCPVLGIELRGKEWSQQSGGVATSPSLDRIDSSRGYVPGNVRVISLRANVLKNNATVAELALVLRDAKILAGLESADE